MPMTKYKCSKCRDTGWIIVPKEKTQPFTVMCDCRKEERLKQHWKAYGINPDMINYKLSNFNIWNESSETAKYTALEYEDNFDAIKHSRQNSILLCGQSGSGKSHLSIALAVNLIKRGVKTMYMPYRDVVTKIKQNMLDDEYYAKTLSKYQTCEVLLIDDLFKGKVNESDINISFEIINYRYLNFLPVIISTEYSINQLLNFDEAVGSRIYEMSKDYVVEIEKNKSNNYRLR